MLICFIFSAHFSFLTLKNPWFSLIEHLDRKFCNTKVFLSVLKPFKYKLHSSALSYLELCAHKHHAFGPVTKAEMQCFKDQVLVPREAALFDRRI